MDLPFLKRVTLQQEICPRAERSDNKLRTFVSASPSAMAISASRTWPCFLMCSKIGDVFMAEGDAPFAEVVRRHLERDVVFCENANVMLAHLASAIGYGNCPWWGEHQDSGDEGRFRVDADTRTAQQRHYLRIAAYTIEYAACNCKRLLCSGPRTRSLLQGFA